MRPTLDRLPPHDIQMEMGVLGCALLDPNQCISECVQTVRDGKSAFYDLRHQTIYETLVEMFMSMKPIDLITVQQRLKDRQLLEQIGGIAYLSQLQDAVPSAANLPYYIEKINEKSDLRKMILFCFSFVGKVFDHDGEVSKLMDEFERGAMALRGRRGDDKSGSDLVSEALAKIESVYQSGGAITGLSTGLKDLDHATDGLHGGEMIVIAAYPSAGKSALAMNIAVHNALAGKSVTVYSHEMNPVKLMIRSICSESRVNFFDVRDQKVTQDEFDQMGAAAGRLAAARIRIKNASGWSIDQLRADARRDRQQHGLDLVVVDYLQLVENAATDKREQQVSGISKGCKAIAMENDVPVLVLSQLNDDGALRESRAIGQDADCVWKIEPQGKKEPRVQPCRLLIDKGRDSAAGTWVALTFLKTITKFECQAPDQEDA